MSSDLLIDHNQGEWNCGLVACAETLAILGHKVSFVDTWNQYIRLGLRLFPFGTTTVHLAFLLKTFGVDISVRSSSAWIKTLATAAQCNRRASPTDPPESAETLRVLQALFELEVQIEYDSTDVEARTLLRRASRSGNVAIACVDAKSFYGIDEDWNHYVVCVPAQGSHLGFQVLDRFAMTGGVSELNHARSQLYDWERWTGDLIEVMGSHRPRRG